MNFPSPENGSSMPTQAQYEPENPEAPTPLAEPSKYRLFISHEHIVPYIGTIVHLRGANGAYHVAYNEILESDGEIQRDLRPHWVRLEPPYIHDLHYLVTAVLLEYGFSRALIGKIVIEIDEAITATATILGVQP